MTLETVCVYFFGFLEVYYYFIIVNIYAYICILFFDYVPLRTLNRSLGSTCMYRAFCIFDCMCS